MAIFYGRQHAQTILIRSCDESSRWLQFSLCPFAMNSVPEGSPDAENLAQAMVEKGEERTAAHRQTPSPSVTTDFPAGWHRTPSDKGPGDRGYDAVEDLLIAVARADGVPIAVPTPDSGQTAGRS
jgi:hypothetical protein